MPHVNKIIKFCSNYSEKSNKMPHVNKIIKFCSNYSKKSNKMPHVNKIIKFFSNYSKKSNKMPHVNKILSNNRTLHQSLMKRRTSLRKMPRLRPKWVLEYSRHKKLKMRSSLMLYFFSWVDLTHLQVVS